ncbi:MAG: SDR family oxidoreductase [Candidatus Thiodiazotropha lotti]|uniref:NAD(P)-dependent oxidoreductase n=1 Tax=Candidatus Thiodiazotropha endoloripes TaxID=1818881 RepID=A0A1E2UM92_9GAMM|nr:SDR family oxidoreductase [Candidatus Thiodiazotropha endoloripes]MCG7899300.1 SDR family oxidoreductase [Candidatus Thiodiazotropha weberae]MCG7991627.1 SDR family oxidoreductase [Candidatus Thiodiazotropha lotti]MCG7903464.1 SDR family oxidoreductase [Candidatus Thiodiazotropha weberae]MCG7914131.1 SDR family oxidoreductase [Candidatus Thiodiazotropha weberae]MCG7999651.1 SDR family oxidoreductase [Candidatus Thiodiazotropha lotti]
MGVTIIGCGDIGTRLALAYQKSTLEVTGWVATDESVGRLKQQGIRALQLNLDQTSLQLPSLAGELLFYFAPPPASGVEDGRVRRLIALLDQTEPPQKVVYLSTSGVYGDCQGEWVDETRMPRPTVDRAKRRLDAEQQWQMWCQQCDLPLVILRVAGIYGPGKLPVERLRKGLPMVAEADSPITNHIHSLDLVEIAAAAMERGREGAIFNVCDGRPESMTRYFNRVADYLQLPRPPQISMQEARQQLSPGMLSYLAESRRLSNRRLVEELGVVLRYPELEQGLPACFE